ncbi:hypothetical protein ABH920_002765 [Catenulispora sp. EB89]|uniref:TnsA-like heteromeric transposase endonuclease subunit n=1 Tax=Catenulispora sp. EB89 TaxID=3156257 RepID=UPI003511CDD3
MADKGTPSSAQVSLRKADGKTVADRPWNEVPAESFRGAEPWRTFRWHKDQKHYSGTFWSSTVQGHVIYESRLELTRLLYADFDPSVSHILAQPMLMTAEVDGIRRRHIPDFLLLADDGPLVVDVKPAHRLVRPKVAFTLTGRERPSRSAAGASRCGPSHQRRNWRTSGSWPATAVTGCSLPTSLAS